MVSHSIYSQPTSIHDLTCKYSYKKCHHYRTTKRNGTLHTLCEYHRVKANTLQQVYAKKKKEAALDGNSRSAVMLVLPTSNSYVLDNLGLVSESWLRQIDFSMPCYLTDDDVKAIQELF
ncbi:Aste57867_17228 [Aphanomyces stellatus]|uniref:Aste57867_17228 protein n=1 Tax=Aphanomyces stellatus TaxID=120398 RepID=A0A485L8M8_9STRA|nr:hypothetical protein As57867_017169 [Aphanomyces stellatus]VFT93985.1 Aste57867_17228 [Aphanomyces stellatus]